MIIETMFIKQWAAYELFHVLIFTLPHNEPRHTEVFLLMFYRSGNKARKSMEPRHTDPEFHSELGLDYTDNAIYLIRKWDSQPCGCRTPSLQPEWVLPPTIQLCTDCTLTCYLFRKGLGERQTNHLIRFLGNTGGRKICWKFRSSNKENSNLYQLVFSRW